MLNLDHLAVVAESLDDGREAVEAALGITLQAGGKHAHFGTHNLLLGMEDGLYLEVIAIDPEAPAPACPRWFDLDRFHGKPKLGSWICRVGDLARATNRFPQAGKPVVLSRGDLHWQMAVPENGALPYDNLFPALIKWQCADHPAKRLAPSGCRLKRLVVSYPNAATLEQEIGSELPDQRVVFEAGRSGLRAEIETPSGLRVLQ